MNMPDSITSPLIALLDDDPDLLATMQSVFMAMGLHTQTFASPEAFLSCEGHAGFDAYVLDWHTSDSNTAEIIQRLRQSPMSQSTPIILLSGNLSLSGIPTDPTMARVINECDVIYRLKPYSTLKLAKEIKALLG